MKKPILFFGILCSLCLLSTGNSRAQAPQGFNYQAVAWISEGTALVNEILDVKIGILSDTITPVVLWEEQHTVSTNEFGLFTLHVGDGNASQTGGTLAAFSELDWSASPTYLRTRIYHDGNWYDLGYAPLLSVPYALFAASGNEGPAGPEGRGISSVVHNADGTLTIYFTTGPEYTTGDLTGPKGEKGDTGEAGPAGPQGPAGRAIVASTHNTDGTLTLNFSDGTEYTTDDLTGPKGDKGDPGTGLTNRGSWTTGMEVNEGDYVFDRTEEDPEITSMWIFEGTGPYTSDTNPYADTDNWIEFQAPEGPQGEQGLPGDDGRSITSVVQNADSSLTIYFSDATQFTTGKMKGPKGASGPEGPEGPEGPQGEQGPPGPEASDDQTLALTGTDITIAGGNTISLDALVDDADASASNELITSAVLNGNSLEITEAGTLHSVNLNSINTDNQMLSLSGYDLILSGGNTVSLSAFLDNTDAQTLDLTSNMLSVSNGNSVDLSTYLDNTDAQTLALSEKILSISGGNNVDLSSVSGSSPWSENGSNLYRGTGTVGIGTDDTQGSKLSVKGDNSLADEPLFEVKRQDGQTVFAVYNTGVQIFVPEDTVYKKGPKGGFAIGGFNNDKGYTREYVRITPDSIRFWVKSNPTVKGPKGGFAIGGFNDAKANDTQEYFRITHDSTRLYINDEDLGKGPKGGFAIGGFSTAKSDHPGEFLRVTDDSVRVYIKDEDGTKGPKGGFAIGGFSSAKTGETRLLEVGFDQTQVFVSDSSEGFNITSLEGQTPERFMDIKKFNYFIGHESGKNTTPSEVSAAGKYNSFIGYRAGVNNTRGKNNVFMGNYSGYNNEEADFNVFIGNESGKGNTLGDANTYIGHHAGSYNSLGTHNTHVGFSAGTSIDGGSGNTTIGANAGGDAWGNVNNNTYIGAGAGQSNMDGSNNVCIGYKAGGAKYSGTGNVFIGYNAGLNEDDDNLLFINNDSRSTPLLEGVFGENPSPSLHINGTLSANESIGLSDLRMKKEVKGIDGYLEKLMQLRAVSFYWDTQKYPENGFTKQMNYGFIAQELELVFPHLVVENRHGMKGIKYQQLIPLLVETVKSQKATIEAQQTSLDQVRQELEQIKRQIEILMQQTPQKP